MKYKIVKNYGGDIELIYGKNTVFLTSNVPSIILTESEYKSIPKNKQYLIENALVLVEFVEEVKEIKTEVKKNN